MAGSEEWRLLGEINTLAAALQGRRLHPLENRQAQWQAVTKLEQDLAACWTQVSAERAGPGLPEPDSVGAPTGRRVPHGRTWRG